MRHGWSILVVAFSLLGCGAGPPSMEAAHERALEDSVLAVLEDLGSATNAGEWDRALALYSRDADFHWVEDGKVRYTSADAIGAGFAELDSLFESATIEWIDPRAVALAPGVGAVTTEYRQVLTNGGGGRFSLEGAITFTAVHRPDGWSLLRGHTSTLRSR